MARKILLIQPSHSHYFNEGEFIPIEKTGYAVSAYPLGLGYLSNALKNAGYEVGFIDLWAHPEDLNRLFSEIGRYDAVGISFYATQYNQLGEIAGRIKKINSKMPIIVGGPGAKPSYKILLQHLPVDYVVFEEGEISLVNLLKELFSGRNFSAVKGIGYKEGNGSVVASGPQPYIKDLDSQEFPDREGLDFRKYSEDSAMWEMKGTRETNLISGRGCPYKCSFCSRTFSGCRLRSVENIVSEVKYLKERHNIKSFLFNDELVIINKKRTFELCDALKELDIRFGCQGRVNLIDEELVKKLKESGCVYLGFGVESYTQSILDKMRKQIKVEDIVRVYKMTQDAGLSPRFGIMWGYIGENDETLANLKKLFKEIDHPAWGFYTQPIPGTELYDYCIERGDIPDERKYLEDFFFGYNKFGCSINLSDYSDVGTLNVKIWETWRAINIAYYKRHPLKAMAVLKEKFTGDKDVFWKGAYSYLFAKDVRVKPL